MFIGLDFGTTNSALALADATGPSRLVPLLHGGVAHSTFRSILYFDADERDQRGKPLSYAGPAAIDAYLEPGAEGRLIQSIKSYLANPDFTSTSIYTSRYTLENLIGLLVSRLLEATPEGRPSQFEICAEAAFITLISPPPPTKDPVRRSTTSGQFENTIG